MFDSADDCGYRENVHGLVSVKFTELSEGGFDRMSVYNQNSQAPISCKSYVLQRNANTGGQPCCRLILHKIESWSLSAPIFPRLEHIKMFGRGFNSETRLKFNVSKVNESLYELRRPSGTPQMELLFFHGLQSGDISDDHLRTWESEDCSSLWPQKWLAEEFPAARILCVAYDGRVRRSAGTSHDMHNIVENLISDFMQENIGQTPNCPVVLIGHCFGGLVIKKFCSKANNRKQVGMERMRAKIGTFLDNVKAVFFYGTPHHGTLALSNATKFVKESPLISYFTVSDTDASRLDFEFDQLRGVYANWLVWGLGEARPADRGVLQGQVVAPEWTSRKGEHFNLLPVDHASICKPKDKADKRFYFLSELLKIIATNSQMVLASHKVHGLPKYPLDLERRALVVKEKLIGGGSLGICGMGGIGKTTLAMQAFNMISMDFEYTCFVDNVKGIPPHDRRNSVLKQFHHNGKLVCNSIQWSDLQNKMALIAMDDVDEEDQLRVLPNLEHFGTGSCIIMTSRNREVFKYYERCIVHEVDLLDDHDAKRLICQHAFGSQDVPEFLIDKVAAVVKKCHGLPLSLEVIGKYLQGHATDIEVWNGTLDSLTRAVAISGGGAGNDKVWASLKISYDTLAPKEKEVFTEAALIFAGEPLEEALAAWSTPAQTMRTVWNNLVSRSLVKEINNRVWVHEHLHDLAFQICKDIVVSANEDTVNSVVDLLNDKQVEATTKCLRLRNFWLKSRTLKLPSLAKLKRLKYVDLFNVSLKGLGNGFSSNLSFLRLNMLNMTKLEFSINKMENLAVLELSKFQIPKEFPDALGNLTNLRILRLSELEGLFRLPENLGNLSRLTRLEVSRLCRLTLPKSFGKLRALKYLTLKSIESLALPESLGDLSNLTSDDFIQWTELQDLYISSEELKTLPAGLYGLKSLRQLTIDCPKLEMLSESLGELNLLERLDLCVDRVRTLPSGVGNLSSLCHLKLKSSNIELLPESLGKLSLLKAFTLECRQLKKLPNTFGQLGSLQELSLAVPLLEQLPESFGELHHLRKLKIDGAAELQTLPGSFSNLKSLQKLTLHCAKLERLPGHFGELCALEQLDIQSSSLESLPESVRQLHSLKKLVLQAGINPRSLLRGFGQIPSLQEVVLDCDGHEETPDLFEHFWQFAHELTLTGRNTRILPASVGGLSSLRALRLWCLRHLESLPGELGTLSSLESLTILGGEKLERLPESLGQLSALREVSLEYCSSLKTLPESLGKWAESGGAEPEGDEGEELNGVKGGESSHAKKTKVMTVLVEDCRFLDEATMDRLGWICVTTNWRGRREYRRKVMP